MRIIAVRIDSYGRLKDRTFELQPGLNVFYGPNEAGKSTLRSFITTTLFPKAPLKYPIQKASDSGSIDIVTEGGKTLRFEKDGRRSSGLGSELCGIDDREYVSIYSMSPEDLRDVKGIEKGEIRNRFLTIPGGADLPRAYEELDAERTKLLPDLRRTSKCEIAVLIQKEHELSMKVKQLQAGDNGDGKYSALAERRDGLRGELEQAGIRLRDADTRRAHAQQSAGRAADIARIRELEEREKSLLYAENADATQETALKTTLENCAEELKKAYGELSFLRMDLGGRDPNVFIRNRDRIERLVRMESDYDFYTRRKQQRPATQPAEPAKPAGISAVTLVGAAVAVVGIAVATMSTVGGVAIAAVGVIIAIIGFRKGKATPVRAEPVRRNTEADERIAYLEEQLIEVANDVGLARRGFHSDVRTLSDCLSKSTDYARESKHVKELEAKKNDAEKSLNLFLSGYGGKEGYEKALKDSSDLKDVRARLAALRESTAKVEMTDVGSDEADAEYASAKDEYDRINRELSQTEQALKDIGSDMSVEDAITARSEAGDEIYSACYKWARLMMEKFILDEASSEAYGSCKPDVLKMSDRFLSSMTGGRYRLNSDPRVTEITVIDNTTGEVKSDKEWSSGLEDQVKLSIKMAVALSLSKEKPPVILDDILLTSDSVRKKAACGALSALARDIQVLYFTCDKETKDFLRMSGAAVHDMH